MSDIIEVILQAEMDAALAGITDREQTYQHISVSLDQAGYVNHDLVRAFVINCKYHASVFFNNDPSHTYIALDGMRNGLSMFVKIKNGVYEISNVPAVAHEQQR